MTWWTGDIVGPERPDVKTIVCWNGSAWVNWPAATTGTNALDEMVNGYDRGDLCADIDRQMGDVIERTAQRYTGKETARDLRREMVKWLAEEIIGDDKPHK